MEIYGLYDGSGELRYIGKARDSQKRLKTHISDSRRRNTPVYCWIRKMLESGELPKMAVLENVDDSDWQAAEKRLILEHRGPKLLNLAEGGNEPFCSRDIRATNGRNNARAIHADPFRRRVWEMKLFMSQALKRGDCSEAVKEKLRYCARKRPELFGCWANV
jgi:hypothetical protein